MVKKILSKCGLRFLLEWLGVAWEPAKDFGQIHIFGTFYIKKNLQNFQQPKLVTLAKNMTPHFNNQFWANCHF